MVDPIDKVYYHLSRDVLTWDVDRNHSTSRLQTMRSTNYMEPFISWFQLWLVHFNPPIVPLFLQVAVPSEVCCCIVFCCWVFDRGRPYFRNFNSTIPVDVIRVKSHVGSFLDPTCAPVRISINKLDLVPNQIVASTCTCDLIYFHCILQVS